MCQVVTFVLAVVSWTDRYNVYIQTNTLSSLFSQGEMNKIIGEHALNKHSSRSHCIFTVHVEVRRICSHFTLSLHCTKSELCNVTQTSELYKSFESVWHGSVLNSVCLYGCGPVSLSHTLECNVHHVQTQPGGSRRFREVEQNWGEFMYHFALFWMIVLNKVK